MTATSPAGTGSEAKTLVGRCLCGAVEDEAADAFADAMSCHCSLCRRTTGSAFEALAGIARERLRLTRGEEAVSRFSNVVCHTVNGRSCGSPLYAVVRDGRFVRVAMGTLVDAPTIRPAMHIVVGSKAPWHDIADDLPQYEAFPP